MITKEEANRIMKTTGEVKGAVLKIDEQYVKNKWGEAGVKKVKELLRQLGYPIGYEKLKLLEGVPVGLRILSLLAVKEAFNLSDEEIKTMGNTAPKLSFIVKLLMRFFLSPEATVEHAAEFWARHYTVGRLQGEPHRPEKYGLITLTGFPGHPVMCKYLEGYFQRIQQFMEGDEVAVEEIECPYKNGAAHVFKVTWK